MEKKGHWIIGHSKDFDFIILGENTGSYSDFPNTDKEARMTKGTLHYINNFVSQIKGETPRISKGPVISKCPAMDDWNSNVREPNKIFNLHGEVIEYLQRETKPIAITTYLQKYHEYMRTLEKFSIKGLVPN